MDSIETYGITKIAHMLGISKEAIRKYESRKLLENTRDETNGYRKYDIWDMSSLIQVRYLRGMGLTLGSIERLFNQGGLPELEKEIAQKKEDVAESLLKYQRLFLLLEEYEKSLHALLENKEKDFWIEYRPSLYIIDIGERYTLKEDAEIRKETSDWLKKLPFVFEGAWLKEDLATRKRFLAIEEKYAEWVDRKRLGGVVQYVPAKLCACMLVEAAYLAGIKEDMQSKLKRIREAGYTPAGESMSRGILVTKRDGKYSYFCKIWIPIE